MSPVSDRTLYIENAILNHCTDNSIPLQEFLHKRGASAIKSRVPSSNTIAIKQCIQNAVASGNVEHLLRGRDPNHSKVLHVSNHTPNDLLGNIPALKPFYDLTTPEKNKCADTPERKKAAKKKAAKKEVATDEAEA